MQVLTDSKVLITDAVMSPFLYLFVSNPVLIYSRILSTLNKFRLLAANQLLHEAWIVLLPVGIMNDKIHNPDVTVAMSRPIKQRMYT